PPCRGGEGRGRQIESGRPARPCPACGYQAFPPRGVLRLASVHGGAVPVAVILSQALVIRLLSLGDCGGWDRWGLCRGGPATCQTHVSLHALTASVQLFVAQWITKSQTEAPNLTNDTSKIKKQTSKRNLLLAPCR